MKNIVLSAVAVLAMSSFAVAGGDIEPVVEPVVESVVDDSGFYLGLGANSFRIGWDDFENTNIDFRESVYGATFLGGYQFNKYVAIEARYAISQDWEFDGTMDISNMGLYVKPMYPVNDVFSVYGLLGYGWTNFEFSDEDDMDDSGFQWGLGASATITDNVSAFVDYTRVWDDNDFDDGKDWENEDFIVDMITVGITYKF